MIAAASSPLVGPLITMRTLHLPVLLLTLSLCGCGGGGGSGSGSGGNSAGADAGGLSFGAISPAGLSAKLSDDPAATRQQLTLTASFSGSASGNVYVVVEDPDKVITNALPTVGAASATLTLDLATGLAPGHYTKSVVVHVCKDSACKSEFAGSPQTLTKDIVVEGLAVGAAVLNFQGDVGMGAAAQSFTVTPPAGKSYSYSGGSVDYKSPSGLIMQLPFDTVFDVAQTDTGLKVAPKGAWAGEYKWLMGLQSPGYALKGVPVAYEVGDGSAKPLKLLTTSLEVTYNGSDVYADVDVLKNFNYGSVNIVLTGSPSPPDTGWLMYYDSVPYAQGSATMSNATHIRFKLQRCGYSGAFGCLAPGASYTANIHLDISANGQNWPYDVPVTFTVP